MRIGFCGSQKGMTSFQKEELVKRLEGGTEFVFGDCIGSDSEAAHIAWKCGISTFTIYPQNTNSKKRNWCWNQDKDITREDGEWRYLYGLQIRWMPAMEPLKRNKLIVDNCELLIATPKEFEHSIRSGTWATIRYAWKTKRNLIIIPPVITEVKMEVEDLH